MCNYAVYILLGNDITDIVDLDQEILKEEDTGEFFVLLAKPQTAFKFKNIYSRRAVIMHVAKSS